MPVLSVSLQGRFGNQCMQWLFARAYAEKTGAEFRCEPWIGQKIFFIDEKPHAGQVSERVNEYTLHSWSLFRPAERMDIEFRSYGQIDPTLGLGMPYTKRQAQAWLRFRPEVLAPLQRIMQHHFPDDRIVAHYRKGDYIGYQYPVVGVDSIFRAAKKYFGITTCPEIVSEEFPAPATGLPEDMAFLPDFYRLTMAPTLLRANSTFSFMAGLLGSGVVLSPRIDGLVGGKEHDDVRFEVGNHCKLADFDFCSDLQIAP